MLTGRIGRAGYFLRSWTKCQARGRDRESEYLRYDLRTREAGRRLGLAERVRKIRHRHRRRRVGFQGDKYGRLSTKRNTNSNYEYLGAESKRHRESLTAFSYPTSRWKRERFLSLFLSFAFRPILVTSVLLSSLVLIGPTGFSVC